jgi:hypothetical protein
MQLEDLNALSLRYFNYLDALVHLVNISYQVLDDLVHFLIISYQFFYYLDYLDCLDFT